MKTRPSSVQMHKQTTAVNPTGVNKMVCLLVWSKKVKEK